MTKKIIIPIVVLLVSGAAAYFIFSDAGDEIAELVATGGEKVLREPMRPAGTGPKVLIFALDGVGEDELMTAVRSGETPHISALVGTPGTDASVFENGYAVPGVLSVLPSITLAAWTSIFTGEPPGVSGVPGNEWFDRRERAFYAPGPVSVTGNEHAVRVYTDGLMGIASTVPTVYERADVRSFASLSQIHRGADLLTIPDASALGEAVTAVATGLTDDDTSEQDAYRELDEDAAENLIQTLDDRGIPDLQVVYFPGVDLFTHVAADPLSDQRSYLRDVIDPSIGRILERYESMGELDRTYVIFVSDHGHTPVLNDDLHSLGTDGEDEPPAWLQDAGFRVRPFEIELDEADDDYQAVLAYQGAFAFIYLADRSVCPGEGDACDWTRPPRFDEDVVPVARMLAAAREGAAGPAQLHGTIDLIFARDPALPGEEAGPYQVWHEDGLVPIGEYLAANPRPELLELESRLEGLATGPYGHRAGDVMVLAKSGAERPIGERFYFSGEYRSWHGSPSAQDSRIPLIVAHRAKTGDELRAEVVDAIGDRPSQADVTPLVLRLLGR